MEKFNYVVWVGGIDDHFVEYADAEQAYLEFIDDGYDDVILTDSENNVIMNNNEKKEG
jgi:hypothetical protein